MAKSTAPGAKPDAKLVAAAKKYQRGKPTGMKSIADKKLKGKMRQAEKQMRQAELLAAQTEFLLPDEKGHLEAEGMEKTYKFTQSVIAQHVDVAAAQKAFELSLDTFGPYRVDYTRNGRHLLIGGRKGHVATFDWKSGKLGCEVHLNETVRDVQWLHNEMMFAVAQKKYVYIYDHTGMELHSMTNHIEVNKMEFLPYHFLLATVGNAGYLRYHDTSVGKLVSEHRSRLGRCDVMTQNPHNAIIHLGHTNGTVTMWSPNMSQPLVKMLCHKGPVQAVTVNQTGTYMTTAGLDGQMKVWDVRTYKPVHAYFTPTPATALATSQTGLLAVSFGPRVSVWKDAFKTKQQSPYLTHLVPGSAVRDLRFCPFDDVLGYGHNGGVGSILVPGAGEANYDALEANPFQTKKQRQEMEVKQLLDKLQPSMITLDPTDVGKIAKTT